MSDPDDQNAEQILRMAELRRQIMELAGEPIAEARAPDLPLDSQEAFLQHILAFHEEDERPLREILKDRTGETFPSWKSLETQEEFHTHLWRLIGALAKIRCYLSETDHLSDAECYRLLEGTVLVEETTDMLPEWGWNCRYSLAEYGFPDDPDGNQLYLKYYADEPWRRNWIEEFPEDILPDPVVPPYNRDRLLPYPEIG